MTATAIEPAYITPTGIYRDGYLGATEFIGGRYTGYRPYADINKDIRADIKRAIKAQHLPDDITYSVTGESYSGGQTIHVEIRGLRDSQVRTPRQQVTGEITRHTEYVLTPAAAELERRLRNLAEAYNHDNSNSMVDYFDTMYYLRIEFESEAQRAYRLQEAEKAKAKRAAALEARKALAAAGAK